MQSNKHPLLGKQTSHQVNSNTLTGNSGFHEFTSKTYSAGCSLSNREQYYFHISHQTINKKVQRLQFDEM